MKRLALLFLLLLFTVPAGAAPKRIALVLGNNAYDPQTGWSRLDNPARDAAAIAAVLEKKLQFDKVILKTDLDRAGLVAALDAFDSGLAPGDTAFFYYSGHGAQADDQNYLIPVSAAAPASSRQLRADSISLNEVLALLQAKGTALNILVLDACRNNPLASGGKSYGGAGLRGMQRVDLQGETLIAFATDPGKVAADGSGDLSPYTLVLSEELAQPGKSLWEIFGAVTARVRDATRNSPNPQTPWKNDTLTQPHYLLAGGPGPGNLPPPPPKSDDELVYWQSTESCGSESCYRAYLEAYPKGRFAALARARTQKPEPPKPPAPAAAAAAAAEEVTVAIIPGDGQSYRDPVTGMEFVKIDGGSFQMGSPAGEEDRDEDEKQHRVSVGSFYLAKHEVTLGQFRRFVSATRYRTDAEKDAGGKVGCYSRKSDGRGADWVAGQSWKDPGFKQSDDHPVTCASWNDANAYAEWLSKETGKNYRLPTEAEWEYAARAGTDTARYWGDGESEACRHANVADRTVKGEGWAGIIVDCNDGHYWTAPVGNYQANPWGLHDMLGNVWEWTCSAYDKDYGGGEKQCSSKNDATVDRVQRGNSWFLNHKIVRSADRYRIGSTVRDDNVGFRLARIVSP